MIGNEQKLNVYIHRQHIATMTLEQDQLVLRYNATWQQVGFALSPHLPLQQETPPINVQRFFRNLLPEGMIFEELARQLLLSKFNTFGLIQALGMDLSGALIIQTSNQSIPDIAHFRLITPEELTQRLEKREDFSLILWDGKPRLSVAGVQEKINVMLDETGRLGFGEGSLCSTHILKFEKLKLSHLVLNEFLTMRLAKNCGLNVANVQLMHFGKHHALLVERFDRKLTVKNEVKRRHIIDGCQALNLPPEYKYERNFGGSRDVAHIREGVSLQKLFEFTHQCSNPVLVKQQIIDWVLFNILVFNFDAHGKNISFFVGEKGIDLAPFYDLVNIKMYPVFEQDMAMGFIDEFDGNKIHAYQLADFADSFDIPRSYVVARLKNLIEKLQSALDQEISLLQLSDEEKKYINQYKVCVRDRCQYLYAQANDVVTIEL